MYCRCVLVRFRFRRRAIENFQCNVAVFKTRGVKGKNVLRLLRCRFRNRLGGIQHGPFSIVNNKRCILCKRRTDGKPSCNLHRTCQHIAAFNSALNSDACRFHGADERLSDAVFHVRHIPEIVYMIVFVVI